MSGRLALRDALKTHARQEINRREAVRRGTVVALNPTTVEVFGYGHQLTESDDFDLTGWMTVYDATVGLKVDDLVLLHHTDTWLLFDVVSDSDVVSGLRKGLS